MKLEIDLTTLDTETGIRAGRCAAVLIMAMLPEDEARLAMQQWSAWRDAEIDADKDLGYEGQRLQEVIEADQAHPDLSGARAEADARLVKGGFAIQSAATDKLADLFRHSPIGNRSKRPEPEVLDTAPPAVSKASGKTPSYVEFTYGNRTFSIHKRGPSAALKQAFADILATTDPAMLIGPVSLRLSNLMGILEEIGRKDLAEQIPPALDARKAELAGVASPQAQEVPQEPEEPEQAPEQPEEQSAHPEAPQAQPEPVDTPQAGTVIWAGKEVRPIVARMLCLKQIARCKTIEDLDLITRQADRLADQLDEMDEKPFATEIRDLLTSRTNMLAATAAQSQATQARAPDRAGGNGTGEPETLRHLSRRAMHELGTRWVGNLLKQHGIKTVNDVSKEKEPEFRADLEKGLAKVGLA